MDAAADYASAARAMGRSLPAYVSYTTHTQSRVGPVRNAEVEHLVVRTRDWKIVKGKRSKINISTGSGERDADSFIFKPECYGASSASMAAFGGRDLEMIVLKPHPCASDSDKEVERLYVDPLSKMPIAAVIDRKEDVVHVIVDQRYVAVDGHPMPSEMHVYVKGSGLMFWLNVDVRQSFTDYRFSDTLPQSEPGGSPATR